MKKFITVLLASSFLFLISCSSIPKTICPEEEYGNLNNTPIYISTKKPVTLLDINKVKKTQSNGPLIDVLVKNYEVKNKSINIIYGIYKSEIEFSNIDKIEFEGIFDKEVGIIDGVEIENNLGIGRIFSGILFGVVGIIASSYLSQLINPIHIFNENDFNNVATIFEIIAGGAGSTILGYNVGFKSDFNSAIEKIKEKRKKEKLINSTK